MKALRITRAAGLSGAACLGLLLAAIPSPSPADGATGPPRGGPGPGAACEHENDNPVWMPSGDRLAFYSNRDGNFELYVVRPNGSSARRLTRTPDVTEFAPTWSPDGSRIAYMARTGEEPWQIHVMNADGTECRRITCREADGG